MIITALKQLSSDRVLVCLEGGEELKTGLGVVTELRLYAGKELSPEEAEELRCLSALQGAREKGLEMLSRRMYSRKELCQKLMQKGIEEDIASRAVSWLSENRFLDDERYAEALARHVSQKVCGAGKLRWELQRRGVERELWDEAVESMPDNSDKLQGFIAARLKNPDDRDEIRKISAALYRRGFSWEEIRAALRRFDAETEDFE